MNKSLLLVMCDVLVLAALSLSTGGFDEKEDCDESVELGAVPVVDLEGLQADLRNAQAVADSARKNQEAAVADAARAIAGQLDAEARAARAAAVAAEATNAKNAAEKARKDAEKASAKARDDAEIAKKGEAEARREVEVARAGEKQAQDTAERAKRSEINARTDAARAKAGQMDAEAKAVRAAAVAAEATNAKNAAEKARKDAEKASAKARDDAEMAKKGEAEARREVEVARAGEKQAQDEARNAKRSADEIDRRYGVPARARKDRIDRIHKAACRVFVTFKKGRTEQFYSPVTDIDGDAYVFARYDGEDLGSVESVTVTDFRFGYSCTSREAYYLKEGQKLDIVFFKLENAGSRQRLTLGEDSSETLRYWISRKTGEVRQASLLQPGLRQAMKDYAAIEPGDVLVDSGTASIVSMALSRGTILDWLSAKGSYDFGHKITYADLYLWRTF